MATNFEFYKDEILGYVEEYASFPAFINGKLVTCISGDCQQCIFRSPNCFAKRVEWLYAEHIEPPKLTKRERAFCEAVQTGWIARDKSRKIYWRDNEPEKKKDSLESCWCGHTIAIPLHILIGDCFSFVKWEDETPWSVADLLKLEVVEEVQHETD